MIVLLISEANLSFIIPFRAEKQLQIAEWEPGVWVVKGWDDEFIKKANFMGGPYWKIYEIKDQWMFPYGKLVPFASWNNALAYQALHHFFEVVFPKENQSFFATKEKISLQLIPSSQEHPVVAIYVGLAELLQYIENQQPIRWQSLTWIMLKGKALVVGTPLLSLSADGYWQEGNHLFPAGYQLELSLLTKKIQQSIDPNNEKWIVWEIEGDIHEIPKNSLQALSLGSIRLTMQQQQLMN